MVPVAQHSQTQTRPNRLHTHTHPPKRLAHPSSPIPSLSTLTSRATHAHPTSSRSTGFCAIWDCISSSSSSAGSCSLRACRVWMVSRLRLTSRAWVSVSHQTTFPSAPNKDSSSPSTAGQLRCTRFTARPPRTSTAGTTILRMTKLARSNLLFCRSGLWLASTRARLSGSASAVSMRVV